MSYKTLDVTPRLVYALKRAADAAKEPLIKFDFLKPFTTDPTKSKGRPEKSDDGDKKQQAKSPTTYYTKFIRTEDGAYTRYKNVWPTVQFMFGINAPEKRKYEGISMQLTLGDHKEPIDPSRPEESLAGAIRILDEATEEAKNRAVKTKDIRINEAISWTPYIAKIYSAQVTDQKLQGEPIPEDKQYIRVSIPEEFNGPVGAKPFKTKILDFRRRNENAPLKYDEATVNGKPITAANIHRFVTNGSVITFIMNESKLVKAKGYTNPEKVDVMVVNPGPPSTGSRTTKIDASLDSIISDMGKKAVISVPIEDDEEESEGTPDGEDVPPAANTSFDSKKADAALGDDGSEDE